MSMRVRVPMQGAKAPGMVTKPALSGVLRRKCSCGGAGECAECKREQLERSASGHAQDAAPPIVDEALQSPGEPLDATARAWFEPRFGHDFSKVRLHADAKSAESAQAVGALAYTVGNDIVFADRSAASGAGDGKRILAHELTHVLQQSGGSESRAGLRVGSIDSPAEREANQTASAVLSNGFGAPPVRAAAAALQRDPAPTQTPAQTPTQTPTQTPGQTQADPVWGSKKWPGFEEDWNAFYQLAVQGMAGSSLKPDKIAKLAAMVADLSMVHVLKHGKELKCAKDAAPDEKTRTDLDLTLPWGPNATWGMTFRSALQSTTGGVDGPITANKAVERACDIADQAARGMLSTAAWQTYMSCKTPSASDSPQPPPKTSASAGH